MPVCVEACPLTQHLSTCAVGTSLDIRACAYISGAGPIRALAHTLTLEPAVSHYCPCACRFLYLPDLSQHTYVQRSTLTHVLVHLGQCTQVHYAGT